ncbi:sulfite exporter TauE/SafE family protein [Corynebacterium sp. 320]|uniref:sulfite exporter TauE/SafE family protein n=1 Tax=Corynebacterium TaxID=1716 RepID=UPI00125CA732|nr:MULTISPECIES: sulfite exporter TauE/SafE family protein [Corynebacterium]KAB1504000.1 sulfite exporter TauE/SafE family protein [Corynebacterium sp. 320]KAB1552901.1 sulfite exporter TauE/SafE family protein [Corynebacterium sp. 321]KAB1553881.1 sulfite exporter TauE/SafE family protein [Corynebacterium sp. 319]KAB3528136.1 sulfite exporter TauE/SafE family protein [Corynebacterium sp. 250]KAB3540376.1 sulfite exporter TauE/SafE family protein [Corynebacterium sp. 366]
MSGALLIITVACAIFIGSTMQRIGGMGMGLISAPLLSVIIGPVQGILLVNVLACINAVMNSWSMRRGIDWAMVRRMGSVMVIGSLCGSLLIRGISIPALQVVVGAAIAVALLIVILGKRYVPPVNGAAPALVTGAIAGFTNTLAGVAGPVITVYAQAAQWDHRRLASTLQPLFAISGGLSFLVKELTGAASLGEVPWAIWPACIVAMILAIALGSRLATRINRETARRLAFILAFAGAFSVLVRGLLAL